MKRIYVKPYVKVIDLEYQSSIMAGSLNTSEKPANGDISVLSMDEEDEDEVIIFIQHNEWQ